MTHVDQAKRTQHHGNVASDLKDSQMTWSTFRRGPRHLGAKKITMEFILQHRYVRTRHFLVMEYGEPNEPEDPPEVDGKKPPTELYLFFNKILFDLDVSVGKFNSLLTSYLRRTLRADTTSSNKASIRGNYKKDFVHPRLSWANFIKGLDFLTIPSFDLIITLEFKGRRARKTKHYFTVNINDIQDMIAELSDDEFLTPPDDKIYHEQTDI